MAPAVREFDPGPDHQIFDRLGYEDSPIGRGPHHARGDVDGDAADPFPLGLDLAGVKPSPNLQA
jgi:hypothetical protein